MIKINKPPKLYRDKTLTEDICAIKNYYYKTRSVSKALAKANAVNTNPNVLKIHKYIPNIKNSMCSVRETINIKNLRIEIPVNTYEINFINEINKKKKYNNILK